MMSVYRLLRRLWRRMPVLLHDAAVLRPAKTWVQLRVATHDEIYDQEYYAMADREALRSAEPIAESIVSDLAPQTVLDIGCGTGALLRALRARGVGGTGLEYSEAALTYCRARRLDVHKFDLETGRLPAIAARFDVVVSTEVAEHLPAHLANRFVDLIAQHGLRIVFTAATPGQGGVDHVNEQPHAYWIEKFAQLGFRYDEPASLRWRAAWTAKEIAWWYSQNLMLFHHVRAMPTT
jgi:cyclopropane fatty-acyl-phospholipid synthase-like methyltransferase